MSQATGKNIDQALEKIAGLINRGKLPLAEKQCLSLRSSHPKNPGILFLSGQHQIFPTSLARSGYLTGTFTRALSGGN